MDLTTAADEFARLVAKRIQTRRLDLGISKLALASSAGLDQRAITFVETGAKIPSIVTLYRIASALGTTVETLVTAAQAPEK